MKKAYEAPEVEIELYELDASVAATCQQKPTYGPDEMCEGFEGGDFEVASRSSQKGATVFYETDKSCDCYYSASGGIYFNS